MYEYMYVALVSWSMVTSLCYRKLLDVMHELMPLFLFYFNPQFLSVAACLTLVVLSVWYIEFHCIHAPS